MMIQGIHKGKTMKEVTFLDATNDDEADLIAEAMRVTKENAESLFGVKVKRYDDSGAVVSLYTD